MVKSDTDGLKRTAAVISAATCIIHQSNPLRPFPSECAGWFEEKGLNFELVLWAPCEPCHDSFIQSEREPAWQAKIR